MPQCRIQIFLKATLDAKYIYLIPVAQNSRFCVQIKTVNQNKPFEVNSWPISTSIQMLVLNHSDPGYRDAIAEMAWTLLVHPDSSVKIIASMTLESLAQHQGDEGDLIGHKILPGLVTLSSDPDPEVRSSSLNGLAQVIVSSKSSLMMETREKAAFQLVSFINAEHESAIGVHKSAIEAIGCVVTKDKCPHKLRDDLFLPKLLDFINGQK